jgi:hypothetical protein
MVDATCFTLKMEAAVSAETVHCYHSVKPDILKTVPRASSQTCQLVTQQRLPVNNEHVCVCDNCEAPVFLTALRRRAPVS